MTKEQANKWQVQLQLDAMTLQNDVWNNKQAAATMATDKKESQRLNAEATSCMETIKFMLNFSNCVNSLSKTLQ